MVALAGVRFPRVYPIADTAAAARRGFEPVAFARALIEGGAAVIQFRHKGHFSRAAFETAVVIGDLARVAGAALVVNDRADLAALLGAGLHLGQEDLPPAEARRVTGGEAMLGLSAHNAEQLAAGDREPVNYLAIGPVFGTDSKENPDPVLGPRALPGLRALTAKPLVAIGGITRQTAPAVLAAGADSVAVIGDLFPETVSYSAVRRRMEEWLAVAG
jgi:thiamine-phosphate pyrophosphorylase